MKLSKMKNPPKTVRYDNGQSLPIDVVVLWVDGNDPVWREKKQKFLSPETTKEMVSGEQRYRDWGLLKYFFRGIEKFAPWARKVHFVTDDQWPDWLNHNAPKMGCVSHQDFIPLDRLPLFNSRAIEMHLHRIPDLAEHFVAFNDDMFLVRPVPPDFFFKNGEPVLFARFVPILATNFGDPYDVARMNETALLNRNFDAMKSVAASPQKWIFPWKCGGIGPAMWNFLLARWRRFTGFRDPHLPIPLLKSTFSAAWNAEPSALEATARSRFRNSQSVSIRLFRDWQLAAGRFIPAGSLDLGQVYPINPTSIDTICSAIEKSSHPVVCANDVQPLCPEEFSTLRCRLVNSFERILPEKSSFEK